MKAVNGYKYQRGATFWELALYICSFGFVLTCALKLAPRYMDDMNISAAIQSVHEAVAGKNVHELKGVDIRTRLSKHFQVSMLDEKILNDLKVEKDAGHVWLRLNYEARFPFMGNIDVVLRFDHEVDLASPPEK